MQVVLLAILGILIGALCSVLLLAIMKLFEDAELRQKEVVILSIVFVISALAAFFIFMEVF